MNYGAMAYDSGTLADLTDEAAGDIEMNIEMTNLVTVKGTIKDAEGNGIAGKYIHFVDDSLFEVSFRATTDASGNYRACLPVGNYTYIYNESDSYYNIANREETILKDKFAIDKSMTGVDIMTNLYKVQFSYHFNKEFDSSKSFDVVKKNSTKDMSIRALNSESIYLAAGEYSLSWAQNVLKEFSITKSSQNIDVDVNNCSVTVKLLNGGKATKLWGRGDAYDGKNEEFYDSSKIVDSEMNFIFLKGTTCFLELESDLYKRVDIGLEDSQTIVWELGNLCEMTGTITNADNTIASSMALTNDTTYMTIRTDLQGRYVAYLKPGTYYVNRNTDDPIVIEEGMTSLEKNIVIPNSQ